MKRALLVSFYTIAVFFAFIPAVIYQLFPEIKKTCAFLWREAKENIDFLSNCSKRELHW